MNRFFASVILVVVMMAFGIIPAFAQTPCGPNIYFDGTNGDENNNGTSAAPFKTQARAQQVLASQSAFGCVVEILPGGKTIVRSQILPATPGTGVPLPTPLLYGLLVVLATALVAGGWWMQRHAIRTSMPSAG